MQLNHNLLQFQDAEDAMKKAIEDVLDVFEKNSVFGPISEIVCNLVAYRVKRGALYDQCGEMLLPKEEVIAEKLGFRLTDWDIRTSLSSFNFISPKPAIFRIVTNAGVPCVVRHTKDVVIVAAGSEDTSIFAAALAHIKFQYFLKQHSGE